MLLLKMNEGHETIVSFFGENALFLYLLGGL